MGVLNRGLLPAALGGVLLLAAVPSAPAAVPQLDARVAYERSQAVIGGSVGAHVLTDRNGAPLALAELRGRPLVISLVFTSCSTVCPITTDHLRDAVAEARRALGSQSFAVLTFGFDAGRDRPAQLSAFADTHHLDGVENWFLASADADTTEALLSDLGFSLRSAAGGFDHVTQTTILDAEGRVYRQVYGETFPLPVLMEPLKDLVLGRVTRSLAPADLWDRVSFLCTVYNPLTGAYRFDYGIFFGIFFGGLSLLITGTVILRLWLGNRRLAKSLRSRAMQ
ncbi:SCO family protein [Pelagibius marinus]|uniref:SCO family protein n=1 Tax=Pelagibius marinus TaxID=2762760 RepID=UPI0018728DEB|nr:SCO family protein [Pelagibius marinus]